MRGNKILKKTLGVVIFLCVVFLGLIVYGKMKINKLQEQTTNLATELQENSKIVYIVKEDYKGLDENGKLPKGSILVSEDAEDESNVNVVQQEIYTGLSDSAYITDDNIGESLIVDVVAGEPIMSNMTTPLIIDHDTREYEICVANLMTDQKENDYVDLRIMFPTGEDMTVLSKKPIKHLRMDSSVFFTYLNAEEIIRLASATIDAYRISGTRLYIDRYVEGNLQNAATPNYLVNTANIDLINSDPNVLTKATDTLNANARISLEERLGRLTEEELSAVAEGHGLTDTAQGKVLLNEQTEAQSEQQFDDNGDPISTEPVDGADTTTDTTFKTKESTTEAQ